MGPLNLSGGVLNAKREWFRSNHHGAGPDLYLYFEPSRELIVNNAVLLSNNPT